MSRNCLKSLNFSTDIICGGERAFSFHNQRTESSNCVIESESLAHAEQRHLSKMAGVITYMAGKQKIVLPCFVIPLYFACLQLLLNKNPSAKVQ